MKRKRSPALFPALLGVAIGAAVFLIALFAAVLVFRARQKAEKPEPQPSSMPSASSTVSAASSAASSVTASAVSSALPAASSDESAPSVVTFRTSKGYLGQVVDGVTYIGGIPVVNKTYSIPKSYGNGLTRQTQDAFDEMKQAAEQDGIRLYISSGFRSYETQDRIYRNHVANKGQERGDLVSARPGHSEHQTGLAFDVNIIDSSFIGTPEAIWLQDNCYRFGFILRYPENKTDETGYAFEPWHFRYVGRELAEALYHGGDWLTIEDYFGITSAYDE